MIDRHSETRTPLRPLDVVLICLVIMTLAGAMLLLSAAKPTAPVDGAIEWREQSPLRALVQLLCLNYQAPTYYAGDVKNLILGLGAGLAALAVTVAIIVGPRLRDEPTPVASDATDQVHLPQRHPIAPLLAAQVLLALYILWSLASSRWSFAPDVAVAGTIFAGLPMLWAFALGNGLSARAAWISAHGVVGVCAVTAATAVWYHYGRNPTLRADFPVGNPTFLAACLIPGILISIGVVVGVVSEGIRSSRPVPPFVVLAYVVAAALCLWATNLADSRGPAVGLVFGLLAMLLFALRGWRKLVPVVMSMAIVCGGYLYYRGTLEGKTATSRGATMRLRAYAWDYAWRMFLDHPLRGQGQGSFTLRADTYASEDVLDDPLVFQSRIAHAHNEWLESLADLGIVGIGLIAAALICTLKAAGASLKTTLDRRDRWLLIGLMSASIALAVEESFGVGLRVSAVSAMFYTMLGLLWAASAMPFGRLTPRLTRSRLGRTLTGLAGGLTGIGALSVSQQDFSAARDAYRAEAALEKEDFEGAIRYAQRGVMRLNPQRVITNLFRLAEFELHTARYLQDRAGHRETRARESEPPDARLMALAKEDYRLSDAACEQASRSLKELVRRAPGFFHHGRLAFWLNLTRAGNLSTRDDPAKRQALIADALVAIERELRRQPLNPAIAMDYARLAAAQAEPAVVVEVLARPLRHHRIDASYVAVVRQLTADPRYDRLLGDVQRLEGLTNWVPEALRLAAMSRMSRGEFRAALGMLDRAKSHYETLGAAAPLGAASFYAEYADGLFFSDPIHPKLALAAAAEAVAIAPDSYPGRSLRSAVHSRIVQYLLADGDEQGALAALQTSAPFGIDESGVMRELGTRYYKLVRSFLGEPISAGVLHDDPRELVPYLESWAGRAIELSGDDPNSQYVAAGVAFHDGRQDDAASRLKEAILRGFPEPIVLEFIDTALVAGPLAPSLAALRSSLRERLEPTVP